MTDIKKKAMDREKWLRNPANAEKQMDQKEIRECARDLMLGKTVDALYHCCRRKEGEKVRSDMALRLSIHKGKDTIIKDNKLTYVYYDAKTHKKLSSTTLEQ